MPLSGVFEKIITFSEHGRYTDAEEEINVRLEGVEENSSLYIILKTFYAYLCRDRGRNNEAIELLETLKKVSIAKNYSLANLYIFSELAYNHWKLSHYDVAMDIIKDIEQIQTEYQGQEDEYGFFEDMVLARIYNIKGLVNWHLGLLVPAAENFTHFLEISQKLMHDHGVGVAYNNLGALNYQLGNVDLALTYIEKALSVWNRLQKIRGYAYAHKNLGLIYYAQNKINLSITNFEIALDQFGSIDNHVDQAITLFNLILVCLGETNLIETASKYMGKLEELTKTNDQGTILRHYEMAKNISYMYTGRLREMSKAYSYFERFVKNDNTEFKLTVIAVMYICEYLIIELKNNNLDEIFKDLSFYINKLKELGSNAPAYSVLIESLILEAKIIFSSGEISEANKLLEKASKIAGDHGLLSLVQRVEKEQNLFNSRMVNIRKMLESDATKYELLNEIEMKDYIDELKKILGV